MSKVTLAVECSACERLVHPRTPLQGRCTYCGTPFEDREVLATDLSSYEAMPELIATLKTKVEKSDKALHTAQVRLKELTEQAKVKEAEAKATETKPTAAPKKQATS